MESTSIKLLIKHLRLTCTELKVALKLQGTNLLLHIDQLRKKHEVLQLEVNAMKKILMEQKALDGNTAEQLEEKENIDLNNCNSEIRLNNPVNCSESHNKLPTTCSFSNPENTENRITILPPENVQSGNSNPADLISKPSINKSDNRSLSTQSALKETALFTRSLQNNLAQNEFSSNDSGDVQNMSNNENDPRTFQENLPKIIQSSIRTLKLNVVNKVPKETLSPKNEPNIHSHFNNSMHKQLLQHLSSTEKGEVGIEQFSRITDCSKIIEKCLDTNVRIVMIKRLSNNEHFSMSTIDLSLVPKIQTDMNTRYYLALLKKKQESESCTTPKNDLEDIIIPTVDVSPECDQNTAIENIPDNIPDDSFTTVADVHYSPRSPPLKRKNESQSPNLDCPKKTKTDYNDIIQHSPETIITKNDNDEPCSTSNDKDNMNMSSTKPLIISNKIIQGDHLIKKLSLDKHQSILPIDRAIIVSNNSQTVANTTKLKRKKNQKKKKDTLKNTKLKTANKSFENPIARSHWENSFTTTNHNGVKYSNNSTQMSFQALINQSSFDPSAEAGGTLHTSTPTSTSQQAPPRRKSGVFVRTQKKQLTTVPTVTLREYVTWDVDDEPEETIAIADRDDDDICIIETVNTPIEID